MMQPPTFGVEFEFALAYIEYNTPLPHPDDARKILHFKPTDEDWAHDEWVASKDVMAIRYAAKRSVRNTIKEAGEQF
jgi:hypothetical protein